MSEQQKLSVTYGSFSCEIVGFQDPLPVLQDVIAEFRQIAWRYPGFGTQRDDAQRDRLSRVVAAKLNAALVDNGVAVSLNEESGGLLVHPTDGAVKGDGWGDLYAKPKPGEPAKKSSGKHAAATVAEAAAAPIIAEAAAPHAEIADPAPETEAVAESPVEIVTEAAKAEPEITALGEQPEPVDEQEVLETTADEKVATEEVAPEPVVDEPMAAEDPVAEPEQTIAAAAEPEFAEPAQTVAAAAADPEVPPEEKSDQDGLDETELIATQVREEVASIVTSEIKEAFADFNKSAKPAPDPSSRESPVAETFSLEEPVVQASAKPAPTPSAESDQGAHKSGLFSRLLGSKKRPDQPEDRATAPDAGRLHLTGRDAVAEAKKPPEKTPASAGEAALDAAFDAIAKQSGAAARDKPADDGVEKDFVFANRDADDPNSSPALVLTSESSVDPAEVEDAMEQEERVAKAKAKVMERAKERQVAQNAATERRLRIIRRERVEEKSDAMADAMADAATGAPAMSAADFAKLAGAASLQELMEASAAYATLVSGKHKFTRSDLMEVMSELDKSKSYSPEARIKSFGKMLRTGVLLRVDDGLFAMSQNHRHPYETKIHA